MTEKIIELKNTGNIKCSKNKITEG